MSRRRTFARVALPKTPSPPRPPAADRRVVSNASSRARFAVFADGGAESPPFAEANASDPGEVGAGEANIPSSEPGGGERRRPFASVGSGGMRCAYLPALTMPARHRSAAAPGTSGLVPGVGSSREPGGVVSREYPASPRSSGTSTPNPASSAYESTLAFCVSSPRHVRTSVSWSSTSSATARARSRFTPAAAAMNSGVSSGSPREPSLLAPASSSDAFDANRPLVDADSASGPPRRLPRDARRTSRRTARTSFVCAASILSRKDSEGGGGPGEATAVRGQSRRRGGESRRAGRRERESSRERNYASRGPRAYQRTSSPRRPRRPRTPPGLRDPRFRRRPRRTPPPPSRRAPGNVPPSRHSRRGLLSR